MACDLSDPAISQAYKNILDGTTSWLIIGYKDTRDKLFFYEEGTGDIEEFRDKINEPVLYGLVRSSDHLIYVTFVDEQISGVRRARAVVHGRSVGALFEQQDAHLNITKASELTQSAIDKLVSAKNGDSPSKSLNTPDSSAPPTPKKPSAEQIPAKKEPVASPKNPPQPTVALPEIPKPISPEPAPKPRVETPPTPAVPPKPKQPTPEPALKPSVEIAPISPIKAGPQVTSPLEFTTTTTILQNSNDSRSSSRNANHVEQSISPIPDGKPKTGEKGTDKMSDEARAKIQDAFNKRESVKLQFEKAETNGDPTQLSGYITVQGGGCFFWKRRWFVLRGGALYFYRDSQDQFPVSCIDLEKHKIDLVEAWEETLIPNSFRVTLDKEESYFFFSDDAKQKELAVAGIVECSNE